MDDEAGHRMSPADILREQEYEHKYIPEDMYGVGIIITVKDFADICAGHATCAHVTRFFFGSVCVALNIWLQFALCLWVHSYVVTPSILEIQQNYAWYSAAMFRPNGAFKENAWTEWDGPSDELCDSAMSKNGFTMAILFLWASRMLGELRECVRLERIIRGLRALPPGVCIADMVHEHGEGEDEKHDIIALNTTSRVALYFLVVLPKTAVCIVLLILGCVWFSATESFADLILNALALEFIIAIDELIFGSFFPPSMQETIGRIRFAMPVDPRQATDAVATAVADYHRSIIYLIGIGLFVPLFFFHLQWAIPGFRHDIAAHCAGLLQTPKCGYGENDCFPYGKDAGEHSVYRKFIIDKLGPVSEDNEGDYYDDDNSQKHSVSALQRVFAVGPSLAAPSVNPGFVAQSIPAASYSLASRPGGTSQVSYPEKVAPTTYYAVSASRKSEQTRFS